MAVKDHVVLDNPTNNFATFLADYGIHHPALNYGNTKITINSGLLRILEI